jgi:hypothetical protein
MHHSDQMGIRSRMARMARIARVVMRLRRACRRSLVGSRKMGIRGIEDLNRQVKVFRRETARANSARLGCVAT